MEPITIPCGCKLAFLDDVKSDRLCMESFVVHQKPKQLLDVYTDFFRSGFQPKRILEIGIKYGGSLALWRHIFPECSVLGIDVELQVPEKARLHFGHVGGVEIREMDAISKDVCGLGNFDLIIDDGSHVFRDITESYHLLWPSVNPGGFYVIEDWYSSPSESAKLISHLTCNGPFPIIDNWTCGDPNPNAPSKLTAWKHMIAMQKPQ